MSITAVITPRIHILIPIKHDEIWFQESKVEGDPPTPTIRVSHDPKKDSWFQESRSSKRGFVLFLSAKPKPNENFVKVVSIHHSGRSGLGVHVQI